MTTQTTTCACEKCSCEVNLSTALQKDGKFYCCDACANGHPGGTHCGNASCGCGN